MGGGGGGGRAREPSRSRTLRRGSSGRWPLRSCVRGVVIADPETVADPVDDVPDKAPVGVTGEGPGPVLPPERGGAAGQLGWEGSREVGLTPLEQQEIFRVRVCI